MFNKFWKSKHPCDQFFLQIVSELCEPSRCSQRHLAYRHKAIRGPVGFSSWKNPPEKVAETGDFILWKLPEFVVSCKIRPKPWRASYAFDRNIAKGSRWVWTKSTRKYLARVCRHNNSWFLSENIVSVEFWNPAIQICTCCVAKIEWKW